MMGLRAPLQQHRMHPCPHAPRSWSSPWLPQGQVSSCPWPWQSMQQVKTCTVCCRWLRAWLCYVQLENELASLCASRQLCWRQSFCLCSELLNALLCLCLLPLLILEMRRILQNEQSKLPGLQALHAMDIRVPVHPDCYLAHFIDNAFDVFFVNTAHASFGVGEHGLKVGPLALLGHVLSSWYNFRNVKAVLMCHPDNCKGQPQRRSR